MAPEPQLSAGPIRQTGDFTWPAHGKRIRSRSTARLLQACGLINKDTWRRLKGYSLRAQEPHHYHCHYHLWYLLKEA